MLISRLTDAVEAQEKYVLMNKFSLKFKHKRTVNKGAKPK